MANTAKIDPKGGTVTWTFSVTHLKLGIYNGLVYDSSGVVLEPWNDQRTDDSIPDRFVMKTNPTKLIGGSLWWDSFISDPSDSGGPFVCTVSVEQGGNVLCQDAAPGVVPPGSGQIVHKGDQITFE
ncbi:MAG TPA: hypothetical protein VLX91_01815 [Candidatus Acidoferrales bacterium]|nr:hypothetical protein [Candidatus Acidoferrales bacterium]